MPVGSLGGPALQWSLPGEPLAGRAAHLRALVATYCVLRYDPTARRADDSTPGPGGFARVSTGEPLSVFPRHLWDDRDPRIPNERGHFESHIAWCEPRTVYRYHEKRIVSASAVQPVNPPRWQFRDRYSFELGVIWVRLDDNIGTGNRLSPCPVLARFLLDPSPDIPEPVFGLREGALTNRRLHRVTRGLEHNTVPEEWHLHDGPDQF